MKKIKTIYNLFTKNMKIPKYINIGIIKKVILLVILFVIGYYIGIFLYSYIYEKDELSIDRYNFEQLEKVKIILKDINREDKQFVNLKDFNEIYSVNIKPIKNCYYIENNKNEDRVPYIFGFKLESVLYKKLNNNIFYVYPKYDLPINAPCVGGVSVGGSPLLGGGCKDLNYEYFLETISNPCQD